MQIRFARINDVSTILRFIRELAEYEKLQHEVIATEDSIRESLFGPAAKAEVLIAEMGSQPVGFALFFHSYSTFLGRNGIYLEDLYVSPSARGTGIGLSLLAELAKIAKDRGCGRLEWSVLDWNTPAINFYERLGAKPVNDWIRYRLPDESIGQLAGLAKNEFPKQQQIDRQDLEV